MTIDRREDAEGYQDAFDDYAPVPDENANRDQIIAEGNAIPDADGTRDRSSFDRAYSGSLFSEKAIRETLASEYLNSPYSLIASNTANVGFYKWEGRFDSFTRYQASQWYEMRLPWNMFVYPKEKELFQTSKFYHRWITAEEMMNHWELFKWTLMVFVNQRIASNYELYIEEQYVVFRIRVPRVWITNNMPVYIYRMSTNFQYRIKITYRELNEALKWQVPFSMLGGLDISGTSRVILTVNRVLDEREPIADSMISDTLGDNIEFAQLDTSATSINLGQLHPVNVRYLLASEDSPYWLGIVSPKFLHEYPILLPTDIMYRPYLVQSSPVVAMNQSLPIRVKSDADRKIEIDDPSGSGVFMNRQVDIPYPNTGISPGSVRQVVVNRNDQYPGEYDGWFSTSRPIVLSDAYRSTVEPYDVIREQMTQFSATVGAFDTTVDEFNDYIRFETNVTLENWTQWMTLLLNTADTLRATIREYYDSRVCPRDTETEELFASYFNYVNSLATGGVKTINRLPESWLTTARDISDNAIRLIERYHVFNVVSGIPKRYLWEYPDEFNGEQRFLRPVEENSFWFFEYNQHDQLWRPVPRTVERKYPDVYLTSPTEGTDREDAVYKAFVFYSDTMNVLETTKPFLDHTPSYDEELRYYQETGAFYKDLFSERFYWSAVKSMYGGSTISGAKWEAVEYALNNESYRRFNELFLETTDPYYKLGLATYLKSPENGFPFDAMVSKLIERIKTKINGYDRVTAYERYLEESVVPSYFDTLEKITDDYHPGEGLVRRPPLDVRLSQIIDYIELIPSMEMTVDGTMMNLSELISTITEKTELVLPLITDYPEITSEMISAIGDVVKLIPVGFDRIVSYLNGLNPELYSNGELRRIIRMFDGLSNGNDGIVERLMVACDTLHDAMVLADMYTGDSGYDSLRNPVAVAIADANDNEQYPQYDFDLLSSYYHNAYYDTDVTATVIIELLDETNPDSVSYKIINYDHTWSASIMNAIDSLRIYSAEFSSLHLAGGIGIGNSDTEMDYLSDLVRVYIPNTMSTIIQGIVTAGLVPNMELMDLLMTAQRTSELIPMYDRHITAWRNVLRKVDYFYTTTEIITDMRNNIEEQGIAYAVGEETLLDNITGTWVALKTACLDYHDTGITTSEIDSLYQAYLSSCDEWIATVSTGSEPFDSLRWLAGRNDTSSDALTEAVSDTVIGAVTNLIAYITVATEPYQASSTVTDYTRLYRYDFTTGDVSLEIIDPGFAYTGGMEAVYFENIGPVTIDSVGTFGEAISLTCDRVNLVFTEHDPDRIYRAISAMDENGMGLRVRIVGEPEVVPIVDDGVADPLIEKLRGFIKLTSNLSGSKESIESNRELQYAFDSISVFESEWSYLRRRYEDNMSDPFMAAMSGIIPMMKTLMASVNGTPYLGATTAEINSLLFSTYETIHRNINQHGDVDENYTSIFSMLSISFSASIADRLEQVKAFSQGNETDLSEISPILFDATMMMADLMSSGNYDDNYVFQYVRDVLRAEGHMSKTDRMITIYNEIGTVQSYTADDSAHSTVVNGMAVVEAARSGENTNASTIGRIKVGYPGNEYCIGDILVLYRVHGAEHESLDDSTSVTCVVTAVNDGMVTGVKPLLNEWLGGSSGDPSSSMRWHGPFIPSDNPMDGNTIGYGAQFEVTIEPLRIVSIGGSDEFYADPNLLLPHGGEIGLTAKLSLIDTGGSSEEYSETDLVEYQFENPHDLEISYEVFIGGKQQPDVYKRHGGEYGDPYGSKRDSVYIRANLINNLKGSLVIIEADHYFIYRLTRIDIVDPGRGYFEGQDVFVRANEVMVRLLVTKLIGTNPYKEIASVVFGGDNYFFERHDPAGTDLSASDDDMNNIDDEFHVGKYDMLPIDPDTSNPVPVYQSDPTVTFERKRVSYLYPPYEPQVVDDVNDRNYRFMNPLSWLVDDPTNGDPDYNWMQGHRIHGTVSGASVDDVWKYRLNGGKDLVERSYPQVPDGTENPPLVGNEDLPPKYEYHYVITRHLGFHEQQKDHDYTINLNNGESLSQLYEKYDIPEDDREATVGQKVLVTNNDYPYRTKLYTIIGLTPTSLPVFSFPVEGMVSDNEILVDWLTYDALHDNPGIRHRYPDAPYHDDRTKWSNGIERAIIYGEYPVDTDYVPKTTGKSTYIHDLTLDDIVVYRLPDEDYPFGRWEDLHNSMRWRLTVLNNNPAQNAVGLPPYGFVLTILSYWGSLEGNYSLWLRKSPANQQRNHDLMRPASFSVKSTIADEITIEPGIFPVNTGRTLRIRKLFPYRTSIPIEDISDFYLRLPGYAHYRNQVHLGDIRLLDRNTNYYLLYQCPTDVTFSVDKLTPTVPKKQLTPEQLATTEKKTRISPAYFNNIIRPGKGFVSGDCWGYCEGFSLHVFGYVSVSRYATPADDGIVAFHPYFVLPVIPPDGDYEFSLYQSDNHGSVTAAIVSIHIDTEEVTAAEYLPGTVMGVMNPMSSFGEGDTYRFKANPLSLNINTYRDHHISAIIDLTARTFHHYNDENWSSSTTIDSHDYLCPPSRWYVTVGDTRYPLVNPQSKSPVLTVTEFHNANPYDQSTRVTFNCITRPHDHIVFHTVPYHMRSVYTQYRVPVHGVIDLNGKLSKPLSHSYHEFWVNGRLLSDEVTIITPTKFILHGLTSLRNLEIIEINQDFHSYFSEVFMSVDSSGGRPVLRYDHTTYLDDALLGKPMGNQRDQYTEEEQAAAIYPAYPQLPRTDDLYKDYPENCDTDPDIFAVVTETDFNQVQYEIDTHGDTCSNLMDLDGSSPVYSDGPTIEGVPISGRKSFGDYKFVPIDDIISIAWEEWQDLLDTDTGDPYVRQAYMTNFQT